MARPVQSRSQGRFSRTYSTCIANINYDPLEGTLQITFSNPSIGKWEYYNVDAGTAAGLMESSSRGQFFNYYIRDRFEYNRIE